MYVLFFQVLCLRTHKMLCRELRTHKQVAEDFEEQARADIVGLKTKVRQKLLAYIIPLLIW